MFEKELYPCRFCGYLPDIKNHKVVCKNCYYTVTHKKSISAMDIWNLRNKRHNPFIYWLSKRLIFIKKNIYTIEQEKINSYIYDYEFRDQHESKGYVCCISGFSRDLEREYKDITKLNNWAELNNLPHLLFKPDNMCIETKKILVRKYGYIPYLGLECYMMSYPVNDKELILAFTNTEPKECCGNKECNFLN